MRLRFLTGPGDESALKDSEFFNSLDRFVNTVDGAWDTLNALMSAMSVIGDQYDKRLAEFLTSKGKACPAQGENKWTLKMEDLDEFRVCRRQLEIAVHGKTRLPQNWLIALLAHFDAHFAQTLRLMYRKNQVHLPGEKQIKYSEVLKHESLKELHYALAEEVIDEQLRHSRQKAFAWLNTKFKIDVPEQYPDWPHFVELCERRNIIVHCDGLVSDQYLQECEKAGLPGLAGLSVGDRPTIDSRYFGEACRMCVEIGLITSFEVWHGLLREHWNEIESSFVEVCHAMLWEKRFDMLGRVTRHFLKTARTWESDACKADITLLAAYSGKQAGDDIEDVLGTIDWTQSAPRHRLMHACVADVDVDLMEVFRVAAKAAEVTLSQVFHSPVYNALRGHAEFRDTYEELFGPLAVPASWAGQTYD